METIIAIFLITRFFFLASFPHFYDSPEYLKLSQEKNLTLALSKSHESIHPIYISLIQLSQRFFDFINFTDLITPVSFISAFFGLLSFILFYLLIRRLFNKRTALLSLIPLTFFPHLWLIQTNIMHESVDHFLLITSLLFFDIFLTSKKLFNFLITFSFLLFAFVNFSGNLIWTPVFFGLYIFKKYRK